MRYLNKLTITEAIEILKNEKGHINKELLVALVNNMMNVTLLKL